MLPIERLLLQQDHLKWGHVATMSAPATATTCAAQELQGWLAAISCCEAAAAGWHAVSHQAELKWRMGLPIRAARISTSLLVNHAAAGLGSQPCPALVTLSPPATLTKLPMCFLLQTLPPVLAIKTANAGSLLSATAKCQRPLSWLAASLNCQSRPEACLAPAGT